MLKPAPIFGDHAVLAMGRELRLFGEADDGTRVTARLTDNAGNVLSHGYADGQNGRFEICLPAVSEPQTGCRLSFEGGTDHWTASDVSVGLLFLAGGQSNMELELQNADEGKALIAVHEDGQARYFNVPKQPVWNAAAIEAENQSHWETVRPGSGADMSAIAYFYAMKLRKALKVPVGVIDCYWGGTSVTAWMDGEALLRTAEGKRYLDAWHEKAGDMTLEEYDVKYEAFLEEGRAWGRHADEVRKAHPEYTQADIDREVGPYPWCPPVGPGSPYRPGGLCDTMLKRVAPCALSGMLYYQAEADVWETDCYEQLMMQMVLRWRELFRDTDVPFLFFQLPMWIDANAQDDGKWAAMRMMQQKARKMIANSELCCLIDCGEYNNIHPTDKRTPGERMADIWLRREGREAGKPCPEAIGKHTCGNVLVVELSAPVACADGEPGLFEVAGQDGQFVPAKAVLDGRSVRLTADGVEHPVAARYAFVAYGQTNVFGEDHAPLCPFWQP